MDELAYLSNDFLRLTVSPALGGSITRLDAFVDGKWQSFLRPWDKTNHVLSTASFPMVPFCNRINQGVFNWQGRLIELAANHPPEPHAIHGFGWQQKWLVEHESRNQLIISHYEDGRRWPFNYFCCQRFSLSRRSIRVEMTICNYGKQYMPAGLGFHPYFPLTQDTRLIAPCKGKWLTDNDMMLSVRQPAPEELMSAPGLKLAGTGLDNMFTGFGGHCRIIWPGAGLSLAMRTSETCDFLQLYVPDDQDFFCVEPQSIAVDGFNRYQSGMSDAGVTVLAPGKSLSIWMELFPGTLAG
ncbi:aldose 1-epimerase [Shewanella corallii]|uniref:Aldose 1-epimerase n=2 Tax=Shewanella TaxID=22 RepID=A0ABT0N6C1_9GAMM|nr:MULTISPECIES: aldose 1-epimerase [Shewanella]MCL1037226.1 aldose 1-epimerase [Shewanella submarina]MCL2913715.1 aldose 1-epimerase [Shewanella corallii]